MVHQNTEVKTTRSGQVLPQVRYHPSIQVPQGAAKTPDKTTTKKTEKTRTQTCNKVHRKNQPKSPIQKPGPAGEGPSAGATPSPEKVPRDVSRVEELTRGQRTNPEWFTWRKNRITASVAHSIARSRFANGKSKTPPASYLAAITGERPRVQTRAMTWGIEMEARAVCEYQKLKTAALGRPVSVRDCGLFIDADRSWLAASPDGIVTDGRSGERLLCLEVKCPYKHRHRRVADACRDDPAFCLQILDQDQDGREPEEPPVYRLKPSHSYFTQIQVQLAVTGLLQADLVVFTLKETSVVPVTFDPELWEDTVSKLELFYRDAVLPHVRQKTHVGAAMPEL